MLGLKRIIIFFIFLGLFSLSFQIGSVSEITDEETALSFDQFNSLIEGIDGIEIFINNVGLSLPMFVPGFGIAWGFFSGWSTGFEFASILKSFPSLAGVPAIVILYSSPFGVMELVAYALATSRSYLLIFAIIKKITLRPQIIPLGIEIGIVVILLLAGGLLESAMIQNL
jgi:hypothetical protein